jgi:hypothetical protein
VIFFNFRETYVFYISLLDDKRVCPMTPKDVLRGPVAEPPRPKPYAGPLRVCDFAFLQGCPMLWRYGIMSDKDQERIGKIWAGVPIAERDQKIALLKDWWAKEGERKVTAKCPSVIEILLKEAEEKAKKEAEGKAKSQSPPKLKEPAKPEGEMTEPKQK